MPAALVQSPLDLGRRRRHRLLLSALVPVAILLYSAGTRSRPLSSQHRPSKNRQQLAVVNFVDDSDEYLWGVYSIHNQLKKFNMLTHGVKHVAMVSQDISPTSKALLMDWLGKEYVIDFDRRTILDKLISHSNELRSRNGVFLKLLAFNMTQFDKLIVLDNDVLVRTNLHHWFDYPAPAATGAKGRVEWNSGAMVIEPCTDLFEALLKHLELVQKWDPNDDEQRNVDVWDSSAGHQGFVSSFFLSNTTKHRMHTMTLGSSILSSSLDEHPENEYLFKYRPHVFETVHFTQHKPFAKKSKQTSNLVTCAMLREWVESVKDAPKESLTKLSNFLRNCPNNKKPLSAAAHVEKQTE